MILLESEDNFLLSTIFNILNQKNYYFTLRKDDNYFSTLNISSKNKKLCLNANSKKNTIELPITTNNLISNINKLFKDLKLEYFGLEFFPFKQSLKFNGKEAHLGNIHYIILSQILLNSPNGLNKTYLYKLMWPLDKNYQINKLDTHLTNLKNYLKEKLDFNLDITTSSGLINLRVD